LLPELKPLNQAAAASRGENNNLTKSMSLDKERLNSNNNVAKIKVVVC
jgi:kinesin family protein 2/24